MIRYGTFPIVVVFLMILGLAMIPANVSAADLEAAGPAGRARSGTGDAPVILGVPGSILVDRAHGQNFDVSGFTNFLVSNGWTVDENFAPVTLAVLSPYDIFIIPIKLGSGGLDPGFTAAEGTAVGSFVSGGGGLWAIHDANQNPAGIQPVVAQFGITYVAENLSDPVENRDANSLWPNITNLFPHAVTAGVSSFGYYFGSCLSVGAPSIPVALAGVNAGSASCPAGSEPPVLAVFDGPPGRAVFSGDGTPLHPTWYPDMLDAEEELLLQNIINFLHGNGPVSVEADSWANVKDRYR